MRKHTTRLLNIGVVIAMVLMAVSPTAAWAAPATSTPTVHPTQQEGPQVVVSAPVMPGDTRGMSPAPTATQATEQKGVDPERPTGNLLPKTSGLAAPSGDAALQSATSPVAMPSPIVNFEGVTNLDGVYPPDTDGDVGPNHYVQMVNVHMAVYNKAGTLLYGPFLPGDLWASGDVCRLNNDGDPIVVYDQFADRWLISQFALPNYPAGPYYECIAISKTGTPTNNPNDWHTYTFLASSTKMNDYPKISVWPDGYYMTDNQFTNGSSWGGAGVFVFDRAKMLNGQAATFQYFDLGPVDSNFGGMLPADVDGSTPPPAGSPAYFLEVDDNVGTPSLGADALRIWKFHVDWTTPANSTFGLAGLPNSVLPVASFDLLPCTLSGSRNCIPQQGSSQKLDAIGDRLMWRAAYRNFGSYETIVFNHTVLADSTDRTGVRWYEVRNPGTTPTIYQQGTYAPTDGGYRWMGSLAMDHVGNIALGYSKSSGSMYPSIYYAGRLSTDPLGTLPQAEGLIINGSGAQTGTGARWGDYSAMSVDPVDDCTFWYTQEYIQTTGTATWQTRIASFKFPNCSVGPQGILAGQVTDASNSNPIVNAAIQATASVTQSGSTASGAGGSYAMNLLVGTYVVTATAYGYLPSSVTGVSISQNTTTTQNFALTPAPSYVVSGTVSDAATGWPLYAKISIEGRPGAPIWTNPATGYYSVTLVGGASYTFNTTAFSAGYLPASQVVGPLSANATVNVSLSANQETCVAPGYGFNITGLSEKFDSVTAPALPTGWAYTVVTNTSTAPLWATNAGTRYPSGQPAHSSPNVAYFNSFSAGSGAGARLYYNTAISMTTLPTSTLSLWMYHDTGYSASNDRVQVQVSTDGGSTWQSVGTPISRYTGKTGWEQHFVSLSAYASQSIRLGFLGISEYGNDVHIDDVLLGIAPCLPKAGGLVVGNVSDANTSAALGGVTVSNQGGYNTTSVATPDDPQVADGFYTLFSPAGSQAFTATLPNYASGFATVSVPLNGAVRQDFTLGAGRLVYTPAGIDVSLPAGGNVVIPATLTNTGALAATYSIIELDKGAVPFGPFEKPTYVVKTFRQEFPAAVGTGNPKPPIGQPYAAGDIIQSWTPTGVTGPWGIAFDGNDSSVWVSSPSSAWGGVNKIFEFAPSGTPTGRSYSYNWNPANGPADAAYNWNTGMLWVMNINTGVANCIYEIDPASGPTGNKICPTSSTGFSVSQRGIAYDPASDTYFAGGWNDSMVYRFKPDGTLLNSKNVGIAIAGLAYNPESGHLFAVDSATASKFYVLDVNNNYNLLGQFTVTGFTGGAGLEIDCDGSLWAVDQGSGKVFQVSSGETASLCTSDVPWLSTSPVTGTLASAATQLINVTLNGAAVQPGIYNAQLKFKHNTPYNVPNMPIKMTVTAPATWGKLTGNVSTLGYCDTNPASLKNVTVTVQSATNTWNLRTDANGMYTQWFDQSYSPVTVTVNVPDYEAGLATGVTIVGQNTTTQDFVLRWLKPCLSVSPASISVNLSLGQSTTRPFKLTNAGAGAATFSMTEQYVSAPALPTYIPEFVGEAPAPIGGKSLGTNPNPPMASANQAPLPTAPTAISLTHSLSQQIMSGNSVSCNASGLHADNHYLRVFDLPAFGISGPLNVTAVQVGIETALAGSGGSQPVEVRLYTLNGTLLWANMTQIGSASVSVADQSLTILNVPIVSTVPAGSKLVVDFFTPSGQASGHSLFIGSNSLGQTAPTYLAAADCGATEPTDVASLGFPTMHLVMNVIADSAAGGSDVLWLSETPISGTVSADAFLNTTIGFDANAVAVPGTYKANVTVNSNDPTNPTRQGAMTLNVTAPASWGVLTGTITSLGHCDATPHALAGATVVLQGTAGPTRTVTTDSNGRYALWLNSLTGPYAMTVTAAKHQSNSASGIVINNLGAVTNQNLSLYSIEPCLTYAPPSMSVTLPWGGTITETLTLTNTGLASTPFTITEQAGGFIPMRPEALNFLIVGSTDTNVTAIQTALTAQGHSYTLVSTTAFNGLSVAQLLSYDGVIWTTSLGPTSTSLPYMQAYLDAGGKLLVFYHDFGYSWRSTAAPNFFTTYFEGQYFADSGALGALTGVDIMAGINPNVSTDPYPDSFTLVGSHAVGLFVAPDTNWAGWRVARNGYKAIVMGFNLNYATPTNTQTSLVQNAANWLSAVDVPWLSENPTSGSVAASGGVQNIAVNFNAAVPAVTQPGTYYARVKVGHTDTVAGDFTVPVTMTVLPAGTQAKINGTVSSLGYCDVNPAPLNNAAVLLQGSGGYSLTLNTNAAGYFQQWVDAANNPYTLTVSAANHLPASASVNVTNGTTTTQDINLRWNQPCVSTTPSNLSVAVTLGVSTTVPLTVANTGAASTTFKLGEVAGGFVPLAGEAVAKPILIVNGGSAATVQAYTTSLTSLVYAYAITTTTAYANIPAAGLLNSYQAVFYAGYPSYNSVQMTRTMEYLDAGGRFFIADNDFGYGYRSYTTTANLYRDYFQATYGTDSGSLGVITGTDIMTGVVTSISTDPYPDSFTTNGPEAVGLFYNQTPGTWAGERIARNAYKAIYLAWDYEYAGGSTVGDSVETEIMQRVVTWLGLNATDYVPWLAESPLSGALSADTGNQAINVTFDSSVADVTQPGTYYAKINVASSDPQKPTLGVPVTMTVQPPATWAKFDGTVYNLAACDVNPTLATNASVYVQTGTGLTYTLATNASGKYQIWMAAANSPLTLTVSSLNHVAQVLTGVSATAGTTTTTDVNLRLNAPCLQNTPSALSATQAAGQQSTQVLTITNSGAALLNWSIQERSGTQVVPTGSVDRLARYYNPTVEVPKPYELLANVVMDGSFEATNPTTFVNPYWAQYSLNYGTVICNAAGCGTGGGTAGPRTGSFWVWFGGSSTGDVGYVTQTVVLTPGVATLNFYLWIGTSSGGASDWTKASIDGTPVFTATGAQIGTYSSYTLVSIDISSFATGGTHVLRFDSTTVGSGNFNIDDVNLDVAPPACVPNALPWVSATPISGTTAVGGVSPVNVTFDSTGLTAGIYTGKLCVNSNDVVRPSFEVPVTLTVPSALSPSFTSNSPVVLGNPVIFTNTTTANPPVTAWLWDFGDPTSGTANTSTLQSPTHLYASVGTYTVTLTATNANGSAFYTGTVRVIQTNWKTYLPLVRR